jgi:tetratricopeptide (TPR) repeat protein
MKRLLFLLMLFLLTNSVFAKTIKELKEEQAREIYFDSVNLAFDGYYDQAIESFEFLISKGVKDKYLYYSLLDTLVSKIASFQIAGNPETNFVKEYLTKGKERAKEANLLYPEDKKILYRYAEFLRDLAEYQDFYKVLQKILDIDPQDIYANYFFGAYYLYYKEFNKAIPYFQKVILTQTSQKDFEMKAIYRSYFELGNIALYQQNYSLAAFYYEKAKNIYRQDYELIKALAFTYAKLIDAEKSIESFKSIPEMAYNLDVVNGYAGVLFYKGLSDWKILVKNYGEESVFLQALELYEDHHYSNSIEKTLEHIETNKFGDFYTYYLLYLNYQALGDSNKMLQQAFLLGNAAKESGKTELAIEYYMQVQNNSNSQPDIYWLIGSLYDDKSNYKDAAAYYELYISFLESREYRLSALVRLSYVYYKMGYLKKSEAAIQSAKKSALTKNDLFQVYFYSGLANLEIKNHKKAIKDFQEALKTKKETPRIYYFLAVANYETKNNKKAMYYLESARKSEKNMPEINNLLAYLYSLEKIHLNKALELIQQAIIYSPDNTAYLDTLGWIYFQKSEYKKAMEVFEKVIALLERLNSLEEMDEIYYHIGMTYEKTGKKEEAERYYLAGYKINPKNTLLKLKTQDLR